MLSSTAYVDNVDIFAGEFDGVLSDEHCVLELSQRAKVSRGVLPGTWESEHARQFISAVDQRRAPPPAVGRELKNGGAIYNIPPANLTPSTT